MKFDKYIILKMYWFDDHFNYDNLVNGMTKQDKIDLDRHIRSIIRIYKKYKNAYVDYVKDLQRARKNEQ